MSICIAHCRKFVTTSNELRHGSQFYLQITPCLPEEDKRGGRLILICLENGRYFGCAGVLSDVGCDDVCGIQRRFVISSSRSEQSDRCCKPGCSPGLAAQLLLPAYYCCT